MTLAPQSLTAPESTVADTLTGRSRAVPELSWPPSVDGRAVRDAGSVVRPGGAPGDSTPRPQGANVGSPEEQHGGAGPDPLSLDSTTLLRRAHAGDSHARDLLIPRPLAALRRGAHG